MNTWKQALLPQSSAIREAVKAIDGSQIQIALVVDEGGRLVGTVTDGDVRRALLRGISLDEGVAGIMNRNPVLASPSQSRHELLALMRKTLVRCIPIVDSERRVKNVAVLNELWREDAHDNMVVIMAGGLGTRLNPITEERPKPMINVGPRPILETILQNCREHGFKNYFLSVNYMADMVKAHFGDGSRWGVSIRYLEETQRLGTAGPLSLIPERPTKPLLVMNGDLLTKINLRQLLDFHAQHAVKATMSVREYDFQVPYGVVRIDDHRVSSVDEKPLHRFFVNAGIYALDPDVLDLIPPATPFDMTSLFQQLIERGYPAAAFPIREYWLDIGRFDDLEQARIDYDGLFR
jgi:dTDP-glucose pyrophosphorylase